MSTRILSHCVCIVGLLWSMSSTPVYADLGDQLFKLLPDDGAAADRFGVSVAISGDTSIVGAFLDNNMLRTYTWIKGAVVVGLIAALTPALTVQWAQPVQQQTLTPPGGRDAPPTEQAEVQLVWFTSGQDFEAFMARQGKVLKGIEDFEESTLGPNTFDFFDDPLESGVPNLPDGLPFPDGLTGLPNLIVQSNIFGEKPADPAPRGVHGLAALSDGFLGVLSDVVLAGLAVDSLDLIFTEEKSGVGLNPITLVGGTTVTVRVYSTTNVLLGMMTTPADAAGTNFIGAWSLDPIGRINIWGPNGTEGVDNIQAWEGGTPPCPWDLDDNGSVGASDLLALLVSWGPCPPKGGCPADFDDNGSVGASDLLAMLINWGPCP